MAVRTKAACSSTGSTRGRRSSRRTWPISPPMTTFLAVEQSKLPELAANECKEFEEAYKKLGIAARLDCMEEYAQTVKEHGADYFRARIP